MPRRHHSRERFARAVEGRRAGTFGLVAGCVAVFVLTMAIALRLTDREVPAGLQVGSASVQVTRIIDGDTLVLAGGEHVRILNIDTAEMPPRSRCGAEEELALAARARLIELTSRARTVTLSSTDRDRDRYGRLLRLVRLDGRDVGEILISEGLAQRWAGHHAHWC